MFLQKVFFIEDVVFYCPKCITVLKNENQIFQVIIQSFWFLFQLNNSIGINFSNTVLYPLNIQATSIVNERSFFLKRYLRKLCCYHYTFYYYRPPEATRGRSFLVIKIVRAKNIALSFKILPNVRLTQVHSSNRCDNLLTTKIWIIV